MTASKLNWIVGPSHALRWSYHVRDGTLGCDLPWDHLKGYGGLPIWSKSMFDAMRTQAGSRDRIAVLVGDFRFGNAVCLRDGLDDAVLRDGYTAIDARALSLENDRQMVGHAMAGLDHWHQAYGDRARYVFWCLFGRQVQDRLAGRHIGESGYRHPTFNYSETISALSHLDIVDLGPLLHRPMHDVIRLFIDGSSHPSQIGYRFLNGVLCQRLATLEAYRRAVDEVESELLDLARQIMTQKGRPVLLTGRSVWLDTLVRYLGASGATKLADAGLIVAPIDRTVGQPTVAQICAGRDLSRVAVVIFSAGSADLGPDLARAFQNAESKWSAAPCIDWETAVSRVIRERNETPLLARIDDRAPLRRSICPDIEGAMVELGPAGMPSFAGLRAMLLRMASEDVPNVSLVPEPPDPLPNGADYRIEGEVLVTKSGIAYLIGGNHSVLRYASGDLAPSPRSITTFGANMAGRLASACRADAKFGHVIFPDKQSVLSEAFPFQPVTRLGEIYLAAMDDASRSCILYPAERLRADGKAYFARDTHLTDRGSLLVLEDILALLDFQAPVAVTRISNRIIRPIMEPGDLGIRLKPVRDEPGLALDPDWPITWFQSPGDVNDGMIDILLSPTAPLRKTVLIFGDSYFRKMLPHLSGVFSRIVCLRTRYLHPEMMVMIQPNIVLTGNAERYLSSVASDREAHAFSLYPCLRGSIGPGEDKAFLSAWNAVTSPMAERSQAFFARHGCGY